MAGEAILSAGLSWLAAFALLAIIYVYSHYAFASVSAHIGAMYAAFLAVAVAVGTPPLLAALSLAGLSNFVSQGKWWQLGFIITTVNVIIWLGIGAIWWKVIGLW